jgi:hypothetical protein
MSIPSQHVIPAQDSVPFEQDVVIAFEIQQASFRRLCGVSCILFLLHNFQAVAIGQL